MTAINVNRKEIDYVGDIIAYEDVVKLAYGPDEKRMMTITYYWRRGTSDQHLEGLLWPERPPIKVRSGMVFNAYHTGGA